jgi:hypothetical protein
VVSHYKSYDATANACAETTNTEFYEINEDIPAPMLDTANANLLGRGVPLTPVQKKNFNLLSGELNAILASQPACPGDINLDGVVNELDVQQWSMFSSVIDGSDRQARASLWHSHCRWDSRAGQM